MLVLRHFGAAHIHRLQQIAPCFYLRSLTNQDKYSQFPITKVVELWPLNSTRYFRPAPPHTPLSVGMNSLPPAGETRSCSLMRGKVRNPAHMNDPASHYSSLLTSPQSGQLIRTLRSRRLFITTLTELKAIAALARMGLSIRPVNGYNAPAAMGMPTTL